MSWSIEIDEESGNPYYFNCLTGASSWTKPVFTKHEEKGTGTPFWVGEETGETTWYEPGWSIVEDEEGNQFWYNIFTEDTSWETPPFAENPEEKGTPVKRRARAVVIEHDDSDEEEEEEGLPLQGGNGAPAASPSSNGLPQGSDNEDEEYMEEEELPDWQAYADGSLENVDLEGLRAFYAPYILTPDRLQSVPLLSRTTKAEAERIAQLFQAKHYPAGAQVLTKNESPCSFFFVAKGLMAVIEENDVGEPECTAHCRVGSHFLADALLSSIYTCPVDGLAYDDEEEMVPGLFAAEDDAGLGEVGGAVVLSLSLPTLLQSMGAQWYISALEPLLTGNMSSLVVFLRDVPFLRTLDESQLRLVSQSCVVRRAAAGTPLVIEGTPGDAFYLILAGRVSVTARGRQLAVIDAGKYFGEVSLLKGVPTTATVSAKEECLLAVLGKAEFMRCKVFQLPDVREVLDQHVQSLTASNVKAFKLPAFAGAPDSVLAQLASSATMSSVPMGKQLWGFGGKEDMAYIITQGVVRLQRGGDKAKQAGKAGKGVWYRGSGSVVGEETLVWYSTIPRNTDAIADTPLSLLSIKRVDVLRAFQGNKEALSKFELLLMGERCPLVALLRDPALLERFQQHAGAAVDASTCQALLAIDAYCLGAFAVSPRGDPLPAPDADLDAALADVLTNHLEATAPFWGHVSAPVASSFNRGVQAHMAGSSFAPRSFLNLLVDVEKSLQEVVSSFKTSPLFKQYLRKLRMDSAAGRERQSLKGVTAPIHAEKANRYGKWQKRELQFDLDSEDLIVNTDTGQEMHRFDLVAVRAVKRSAKDGRLVRLQFRDPETKDYQLRFPDSGTAERWCLLAGTLAPDMVTTDDCEEHEGTKIVFKEVYLMTKSGSSARVLELDMKQRTLTRFKGGKPSKAVVVTQETVLQGHTSDEKRLIIIPNFADSQSERWDLQFSSAAAKERFAGRIRALAFGLSVDSMRVQGLGRAGLREEKLSVWTGTWNVGETKPPKDVSLLAAWFPPHAHDIYALALEECKDKDEWLRAISTLLGPSTGSRNRVLRGQSASAADIPRRKSTRRSRTSSQLNHSSKMMGDNAPYVFVDVSTLWAIHVAVWVRAELFPYISHILTGTEATGIGGVMGNKGGAGLGFMYRESTSFMFMASHLAARATRLTQRGANYAEICRNIHLNVSPEAKKTQLLHGMHHVFWMGDLNYRIDMGNHGTKEEFTKVSGMIEDKRFAELSKHDQLKIEVENGKIFSGFFEGPITFPPTYRMLKGSPGYSNKKNQNASWTDRILLRSRPRLRKYVEQTSYRAELGLVQSDHRPVCATWRLKVLPPYINTEALGGNSVAVRVHISFPLMRYSDIVLPRSEMVDGERGLRVRSLDDRAGVAAAKRADTTLEEGVEVTVTVSAPFLEEEINSVAKATGPKTDPYRTTWSGPMIPDAVPGISDMAYLKNQHLLVTLKKKNGQVLGQTELPLWPGWTFHRYPVSLEHLTLAEVLQHPFLSEVFDAHCKREHTPENLEFYRAVQQFKEDAALAASRSTLEEGKDAGSTFDIGMRSQELFDKYIAPTAAYMVNLSSRSIAVTQESLAHPSAHMFDEAVAETFKLMESDSFPRFLRDLKSMHGTLTPDRPETYGAPFAVPVVRDGCSIGVLRGLLAVTSIDSTMSKEERIRSLSAFMRRTQAHPQEGIVQRPAASHDDFSFDQDLDIMASLLSMKGGSGGGDGSPPLPPDGHVSEFDDAEDIELEKSIRKVLAVHSEVSQKEMKLLLKLTYDKWRAERRKRLTQQ